MYAQLCEVPCEHAWPPMLHEVGGLWYELAQPDPIPNAKYGVVVTTLQERPSAQLCGL